MWGLILTATPFVNTWAHLNKKKRKKGETERKVSAKRIFCSFITAVAFEMGWKKLRKNLLIQLKVIQKQTKAKMWTWRDTGIVQVLISCWPWWPRLTFYYLHTAYNRDLQVLSLRLRADIILEEVNETLWGCDLVWNVFHLQKISKHFAIQMKWYRWLALLSCNQLRNGLQETFNSSPLTLHKSLEK